MMIYFAASTAELKQHRSNYQQIIKIIESFGLVVAKNRLAAKLEGERLYKDSEEMVKGEIYLLTQADFIVAEISVPSFGVGYAIKQALIQRKPVLCLYPDIKDHTLASEVFLGNTSDLLKVEFYNNKNLKQILINNLDTVQSYNLLKFNFLISQEISEYLDWITETKKQSKSEFLREAIVSKIINQDKEYQLLQTQNKSKKNK